MNVLLVGSGGREHALAYKIAESSSLSKLYIAPGNPGTSVLGENVNININDFNELTVFCKKNNIELCVIGPEQPLVNGLGDHLRKEGIKVFGPDSAAAEIEAHKSFAKRLMLKYNIPTAEFVEFSSLQYKEAKEYLSSAKYPVVLKANGLAAGKGVLICDNFNDAVNGLDEIFVKKTFGEAGDKIIIEEFMTGEEASIFAITDGEDFLCLPASQDHKRIGENDTGKNTGGMGAYSPAPLITPELMKTIELRIIKPAIDAMKKENRRFIGCLYAGLMITEKGPKVVEFNCRFGDPETQAVLPLLKGDFLRLLNSAAGNRLDKQSVIYSGGSAVCVVASSAGYPGSYKKGYEISGLDSVEDSGIMVFHAGTKSEDGKTFTAGGRVLGVTAVVEKNDLQLATEKAYAALSKISFDGMYFRRDIAGKALR